MAPPAPNSGYEENPLIHSTATLKMDEKEKQLPITKEVITLQPQIKAQEAANSLQRNDEQNMEEVPLPPKNSDKADWAIGLALCCNVLQDCWWFCFSCATCQCECCGSCLDDTLEGLVECCNGCGECCIHCCN